jgi:hypothetical protein
MTVRWVMLGLAAALGACAEQAKIVRTEEARTGYISWTYTMTTTRGGDASHQVFLKPSNEGGKLVVCGYIVASVNSIEQQLIEGWWRQADVSLNDTPIGKGYFLTIRKSGDRQATCIETSHAWQDKFRAPQLQAKGQVATTSF